MEFLPAVELASRAVDHRSRSLAILSHVRVTSDGKTVTLTGTDLDTEVRATVDVKAPDFDVCAPADILLVAAKSAAPKLSVNGKLVVGDDPRFTLNTLPATDFPVISAVKGGVTFDLPVEQFAGDLQTLRCAISDDEVRFYLNGIYFHVSDSGLTMTATDGHKLIRLVRPVPTGAEKLAGSILRRRAVPMILAAIDAQPDVKYVSLTFADTKARLDIGAVTITTKLIDGVYPDYTRVIPTQFAGSLTFNAADLMPLTAAAISLGERKQFLELNFGAKEVRASSHEHGEMTASLPGETVESLPAQIGFNAGYLRSILETRPEATFTLGLSGACGPALFTCDEPGFTAVLMPVRL